MKSELIQKFNSTLYLVNERTPENHRATLIDHMMLRAILASFRSTCNRANVGCVIFNSNFEVTGYNGSPKGQKHCTEVGCLVLDSHCRRAVHAEMNAIFKLNKVNETKDDLRACVTHTPCFNCLNLLAASGVKTIYILDVYRPEHLKAFTSQDESLALFDFHTLERI